MKVAEIRGKDSRELKLDLHEFRKEEFNMRFRAASEEVAKTARFREIRQICARIMTVLREREIKEQKDAKAAAAAPARTDG